MVSDSIDSSNSRGRTITRKERERRMQWVADELARMTPLRDLYVKFSAQFGAGRRCAEKYVRRVHDEWAEAGAANRETKRAEIERSADLVYREALLAKNFKVAVQALDLKTRLHGLNRPDADAAAGPVTLIFELEERPLPAAPHLEAGGDSEGVRAVSGPRRG